ncbi:MAG TPA: hypothetical protein DCQ06_02065 [Myxococcales bacterium]|nr:hypothetical protein [Myxococcales bacterium]HAN30359.1 hypothetical protein [Myxococcales bacterium]
MAVDIALIDLDHTLIAGNTNTLWHQRRKPTWREVLEGLPALLSLWTRGLPALQWLSRETLLLSYWMRRVIYGEDYPILARQVAEANITTVRLRTQATLEGLRGAGVRLIMVSASDSPLARAFADLLDLDEVIAVTGHGLRFERPVPYGSGKVAAVQAYLGTENLGNCAFLSDHFSDAALLHAVGLPVAVNPDERLDALAHQYDWLRVDLDDPQSDQAIIGAILDGSQST